jgi:hypothetical protein
MHHSLQSLVSSHFSTQQRRAGTEGAGVRDLASVRTAGYTDGEIAEIIAHVALNVLTNYFNRAAQTDIDFPLVTAGQFA